MSNKLSWSITTLAVIAMAVMVWMRDEAPAQGEHVFRPVSPITSVNKPLAGRDRIEISHKQSLAPGQMVDISEYPIGEINIQKLTDNTYWILHNVHAMTMYVGENEVLLVDSPEDLFVGRLLDRIAEITPNPVTTLVYTHPHLDHIKGATALQKALAERGQRLRIIGSERLVAAMDRYKQTIPRPTEVLKTPVAYFEFDGQRFKLGTPVDVAHSTADSYVLFPDRVITFIDFIYPNRLPLHDYSGVQNMTGYTIFLRHVAGEEWEYANTGHVNISAREDLARTLEYTKDLYDAWFEVIPENWGVPEYIRGKMKGDYVAVWLRNMFDRVAYGVAKKLEPKWGHYPQFELAIDHAMKVQWDGFLHYDFFDHPEIRPDFTPIEPVDQETQ
jgi:glyoxylase-like metal-dependent hydrolase (beta-lactamase superfamily II)